MASKTDRLQFLLIPLMSQSHLIPLTDFAKLVACRGISVTIITTPLNVHRFKSIIGRTPNADLKIHLLSIPFPCKEAGLPEGVENVDSLDSPESAGKFFLASSLLKYPLEKLVSEMDAKPNCIVSSNALPWTVKLGEKFGIPTYFFNPISCFTVVCSTNIAIGKPHEAVSSDSEPFAVPDMPHRIEFTRAQLPENMRKGDSTDDVKAVMQQIRDAVSSARGVLVNSFEELEAPYIQSYKKTVKNLWCVGPVSLSNDESPPSSTTDERIDCLKWLDSMNPSSVIYACFGSISRIPASQLIEIGLGLEASRTPFLWIIKEKDISEPVQKWLDDEKFEERIRGRGLLIKTWAPQVQILAHPAVGGFLTHCGWNSTLEGVCAGLPMITWPMIAEQFYNEKFIVNVLGVGVRIGAEGGMESGAFVGREEIKKAVVELMGGEEEREGGGDRRRKARELGEMAKRAVADGGSSHLNISFLIQDVMQQS